jgi:hypothetical protein
MSTTEARAYTSAYITQVAVDAARVAAFYDAAVVAAEVAIVMANEVTTSWDDPTFEAIVNDANAARAIARDYTARREECADHAASTAAYAAGDDSAAYAAADAARFAANKAYVAAAKRVAKNFCRYELCTRCDCLFTHLPNQWKPLGGFAGLARRSRTAPRQPQQVQDRVTAALAAWATMMRDRLNDTFSARVAAQQKRRERAEDVAPVVSG